MKKLYCVIDTSGEIVGRFTNKNRANDYAIDYFNSYNKKVHTKTMTIEEYLTYTKNLIDRIKNI